VNPLGNSGFGTGGQPMREWPYFLGTIAAAGFVMAMMIQTV
jgi:hypothetical protein